MMCTRRAVAILASLILLAFTVNGKPVQQKKRTQLHSVLQHQQPKLDNNKSEANLLLLLKKQTENIEKTDLENKNFPPSVSPEKLVEQQLTELSRDEAKKRPRRSSSSRQGSDRDQTDKQTEICREICR